MVSGNTAQNSIKPVVIAHHGSIVIVEAIQFFFDQVKNHAALGFAG